MENLPRITISSLDLSRLEQIIAQIENQNLPHIDALRRELDRADVVEPTQIPADLVTMNSTVRFVEEATQADYELTLVYPDRAGETGTISILLPVGSALLGLSIGQSIDWQVPGGRLIRLRIVDVLRQPEAMGDYHL
ncbi:MULTISPECIES: nucleoside diphosphate kinase regulator [Deefgea]|uniref:Nucleoside diphosphate kinase regulator n=1 Tax=Deefgea chitinilytica TaxID=570276 RepID=A0ABS2C766_9NEIS|nr:MULTISPECIES: nucleoside diphosphate kinase regulator [Deefgea]MBM5569996.1 nucleoside diphosphate kinase regulator [Deefgea chitinilytica]MBM9887225.1 nucleoside diphosphate kinase regulator [Deefgea sp. CFH1-16]